MKGQVEFLCEDEMCSPLDNDGHGKERESVGDSEETESLR